MREDGRKGRGGEGDWGKMRECTGHVADIGCFMPIFQEVCNVWRRERGSGGGHKNRHSPITMLGWRAAGRGSEGGRSGGRGRSGSDEEEEEGKEH